MDAVNYSELRANLKTIMDNVSNSHDPVIITRKNSDNLVLLSYEDFSAMEESAYLLRNPKNAKRLRDSLESYYNKGGQEKQLIELD